MNIEELKQIAREFGVVGAGGAGFPAYAKMSGQADSVILNCVECEPLLKLHRQLLAAHTEEIISMLEEVRAAFDATEAVVGIKSEYKTAIAALKKVLVDYPHICICETQATYPSGDEVVLVYEATGRVIRPGGLPIEQKAVVYNTETMYNLYRAVHLREPVTHKLVSIVGEVENPVTVRLPIGMTLKEAVGYAGRITTASPAFLCGGPMMGFRGTESTIITRTTNAIIVLPDSHRLITGLDKNIGIEKRRASSSCCQCRTCTDLCPRHALGHPIEPHRVMRAVANMDVSDISVYVNTAYCCGCGVCEKIACPQSLSPKSIIQEIKSGLKAAGVSVGPTEAAPVEQDRELKKVPVHRMAARLGLGEYDKAAPLMDQEIGCGFVSIPLSQHIGAPAVAAVAKGDRVAKGQLIANPAEGLSVGIHSSISGMVEDVTDKYILIRACK